MESDTQLECNMPKLCDNV